MFLEVSPLKGGQQPLITFSVTDFAINSGQQNTEVDDLSTATN